MTSNGPVPRRLARRASGLKHLRWAREVLGTLEAHYEHDPRLDADERALVLEQVVELRSAIERLSAAVKPYRDFLERRRTQMRGMVRVGRYLQREARGAEAKADADAMLEGFLEAFENFEARERAPLREALGHAIDALRAHLEKMDRTLGARLGAAFVDGSYPELDSLGERVVDDGDDDDDAAT